MHTPSLLSLRIPEVLEEQPSDTLLFRPQDLQDPLSRTVTAVYLAVGRIPQVEYLGAMRWALGRAVDIADFVGLADAGAARALYATLLNATGQSLEALEVIDEALEIHRRDVDSAAMARAFYLRGRICQKLALDDALYFTHCIHDLSFALILADPDGQPGLFNASVHALCETVPLARCMEHDLSLVLKLMTMRFDSSRPGRPAIDASPELTWRRWLRALILARFGSHRRAEAMLELCRRDFIYQKALPEFLVVSMDLGEIYFFQDRQKELLRLSSEMAYRFRSLASPDVRGALLLWRDAILHEDLSEEIHLFTRERVCRWMRADLARRISEAGYEGPEFVESTY